LHFVEPKGSLPYTQDTMNAAYSEPDKSGPHLPILFV